MHLRENVSVTRASRLESSRLPLNKGFFFGLDEPRVRRRHSDEGDRCMALSDKSKTFPSSRFSSQTIEILYTNGIITLHHDKWQNVTII